MYLIKLFVTVIVGLFLVGSTLSQNTDYCSTSLCGNKKHIACNNNGSFAVACRDSAYIIPITNELRLAIVRQHNTLRNRIAKGDFNGYKPALRMAPMRWNNELSTIAEFDVKQCATHHKKCHNTSKFKFVGQNSARTGWGGTRTVAAETALQIQIWFKEWIYGSMSIINSFKAIRTQSYHHFTTLIQEKNTDVGCAILRQQIGGFTNQFITCNYAYRNIVGMPVYRRGPTAANCTTGTHISYPALCSLREEYDVNIPNSF